MQATIRLDGGHGRDHGVIMVQDAPAVSGPLFFTLQRFPDGKFLSASSLWRTARDRFRSEDYRQKPGLLFIPVGPDILYELDSSVTYRMSINDGSSFALTIDRKVFTALQGKAALEAYQKLHTERRAEDEHRAHAVHKAHMFFRPVILVPLLAVVVCLGLAAQHLSRSEFLPLQAGPATLSSAQYSAASQVQAEQTGQTTVGTVTSRENFARIWDRSVNARTDSAGQTTASPFAANGTVWEGASSLADTPVDTPDDAETTFTRTVHDYLQSDFVSPELNVMLARQVRVPGADDKGTDTAFQLLLDAANEGNTEAMFMLAQYYDPLSPLPHGSVEEDPILAREWYTRASDGGLAQAAQACAELRTWLETLAARGDKQAQNALRYW